MKTLIKSNASGSREHPYTTGECHTFAIALHRLTGAPLVSIARKTPLPEEKWYGDEEDDKFDFEHAHAGVLIGKDVFVDVNGAHRFDSNDSDCLWMTNKPETSAPYLYKVGADQTLLESCFTDAQESDIHQAMCDAMQWGCVAVVNRLFRSMERAREVTPDVEPA